MQAGHGQFRQHALASLEGECRIARTGLPILKGIRWLTLVWLSSFAGCSHLHLPAIDPYGSSIFLPHPNSTQLTIPKLHEHNGQPGFIPSPAFVAPVAPPPCVDAGAPAKDKHGLLKHHKLERIKAHFASPGKAGEIQLTPLRVVAPVGGEVVLLAGICGQDGYLVKRQPLEWMLSPDSVGTFIEVGDDSPGKLISTLTLGSGPDVEKLDVDFARGRTSYKETLITRGSPECNDDIQLAEGQTWLSISSPSEGVSRVTVLAPDSEIWDRRRQTATIYWVDAQWEFPRPGIARSGDSLQFVTRVTKAENLVPAEDWIVQYTIVDPSVAMFVPATGSNTAIVRVNSDSQAIVQVAAAVDAQGAAARGTTPILIDVIRPAQPSDNLPELKLGSGQTFATFSSPGLNLQAFGPQLASVGEQLTYVASLGNPGDVDAENARLLLNIPAGTKLISAAPQASTMTNSGLIWDQGILPAHRQLDVSVVLEALRPSEFDVVFQGSAAGNLLANASVRTEVIAPSVDLRFEPVNGAAQAEIGQRIEYGIDITNTSRQTLTDLRVVIESDPGLPEENQGANKVEQNISFIQPGQTYPLGVAFIVRQEQQLRSTVRVYSGEQLLAERSASVLGIQPKPRQPGVGVNIEFPESIQVGQTATAIVTVSNPSEVKLTGLNVEFNWDPSLRPTQVDNINASRFRVPPEGRTAVWNAQDLLPRMSGDGDTIRQIRVAFECVAPAAQGAITVRATAAEGVQAEDNAPYRAITNQVVPPVTPPQDVLPPDGQARSGKLEISLSDFNDPTIVGAEIRYSVRVRNGQNVADRGVRIELRLPPGVSFASASNIRGDSVVYQFGSENTVIFEPIEFLRRDETINYIFVLIPQVPGYMRVQGRVYSSGQPTPSQIEETTTVNPRNQP